MELVTRIRFVFLPILYALALSSCMKGPTMGKTYPFSVIPFDDFDVEQQTLQTGLGDKNFHIIVPDGGKMDEIWISKGDLKRRKIALDQDKVSSNYVTASTPTGLYLFEGSGVSYFTDGAAKQHWIASLEKQFSGYRIAGPAYPFSDGSAVAFFDYHAPGEVDIDNLDLIRFFPQKGKQETLLSLPNKSNDGDLERIDLPNGFIATRWSWHKGVGMTDPAQFYGLDGKPYDHPLAKAITLLHKHNIDLRRFNFYPSQTKDAWGIFSHKPLVQFPDKHLYLLSATDTTQAIPVVAERNSLERQESLSFVLIHPKLNLFVLGVKQGESVLPYLGHVSKDGPIYRAETFRLRPFPEMEHALFSRDGQVLLFAARMNERTNFVFADLADLLADINRRYPEAKLDLDSLEAEVK